MTNKQLKTNLLNIDVWMRLLYMVLTMICLFIARFLIWFVALFQFLLVLLGGRDNDNLRNFGQGVSKWAYQGLLFITFNSEEKPFPFNDWPTIEETESYTAPEQEVTAAEPAAPAEQPDEGGEAEVQLDDEPEETVNSDPKEAPSDADVPSFIDDTDDVKAAKKNSGDKAGND